MYYPQGVEFQNPRVSSFSKEDPLSNIRIRIRSELYDVPMIRMDDFGILNKAPTMNENEMRRINETVKKIQDLKDKYRA